jgi:hypothetical protein
MNYKKDDVLRGYEFQIRGKINSGWHRYSWYTICRDLLTWQDAQNALGTAWAMERFSISIEDLKLFARPVRKALASDKAYRLVVDS